MVTSLRLLATFIAGLQVSNLVVALLPEPDRPMIKMLYTLTDVILLNIIITSEEQVKKYLYHLS